ncbi:hypothetical protein ACH4UM_40260 [Streptomyces sp. NPDC020801]|uniref:hypothetical protein n=1 Tax=unclassified Streptomyces TaxID=2593676 RepID=UPI00379A88B0
MGEHEHDQDDVAEPARPPLTAAQAREMTAGLREAMDDVRRSVAVLAARVRDAHAARVRTPRGQPSWEAYCDAEFGISRAQAHRLLDVARALAAIHSHARHRPGHRGRARPRPVPARSDRRLRPQRRRRGVITAASPRSPTAA